MSLQHSSWLEIDLSQFSKNIGYAKELIGCAQLCAVMKADAYGLGLKHLLPEVIAHNVPYIAVTHNNEAEAIRSYTPRYQGKILRVRTATPAEVAASLPYHVEEMIGHWDNARFMNDCALQANTQIAFHLKLNSAGMGRNGLDMNSEAGRQQALQILALPGLKVVGIMTHFPKESLQDIQQSLQQFLADCDWIIQMASLDRSALCLHAASSYAALASVTTHLDMVRLGGLLYGDGFLPDFQGLPHIVTFKSRIASINEYPAGSSVSYEREHILTRDSKIATVLVGYANGYRRAFSHQANMLVHQQRVPVVGRISMNVTTIDVTDVPSANVGDEVVIFGKQGTAEITQAEIEAVNQALFADLYTVLGQCNPKVFI